eukprot:5825128-Ditylum_brightwellii.AAC.1
MRETTVLGDPMVDAPDKTTDKTNKSAEQDTEAADHSGGWELLDISDYEKRSKEESMYKLCPKDGFMSGHPLRLYKDKDFCIFIGSTSVGC